MIVTSVGVGHPPVAWAGSRCKAEVSKTARFKEAISSAKDYLAENWIYLTPMGSIPLAAVFGWNLVEVAKSSSALTLSMIGLDYTLDHLMDLGHKYLKPSTRIPLLSSITNGGEAATTGALIHNGDPVRNVIDAPMASNEVNPSLLAFAFAMDLPRQAVHKKLIQPGERFWFSKKAHRNLFRSLLSYRWHDLKGPMKSTMLMMSIAMSFQMGVKPMMAQGNYMPLYGWLLATTAFVGRHFWKTTISKTGKVRAVTSEIDPLVAKNALRLAEESPFGDSFKNQMQNVLGELTGEGQSRDMDLVAKEIKTRMIRLKKDFDSNPTTQSQLQEFLKTIGDAELNALFEVMGFRMELRNKLPRKEKLKIVGKFLFAAAGVIGSVVFLDYGVNHLAAALPLPKTWLVSIGMGLMTSMGEYKVSRAELANGNSYAAVRNMSDSGGVNGMIGITGMLMGLSLF